MLSGNGRYPLRPLSWTTLKQTGRRNCCFWRRRTRPRDRLVPEAVAQGLRVIDLSGAWRLKQAQHRAVYGFKDEGSITAAELTEKAIYGLPELNRDRIASAAVVANPGCYATSVILALAPLLRAGWVDRERGVISDSKSGVSGAGKEPTARTHFVSVADNLSAYAVFGHRHTGEILEQLGLEAGELIFTPHLLPIPRGILSTIYVHLNRQTEAGGGGRLLPRVLPGQALGADFCPSPFAGNSVFRQYQSIATSGLLPGRGWTSAWCWSPASTTCSKARQDKQCKT